MQTLPERPRHPVSPAAGPPARPSLVLSCAGLLFALSAVACTDEPQERARREAAAGAPQLFREYGCAGCHSIPGVPGAHGRVGPPLWALGDRGYIAGVLPNTDANLKRWILDPPRVNPLTAMPAVGVTEEHAGVMAAYLRTLRAEPVALRMTRGFIERAMGRRAADIAVPGPGGGR